MLISHQTFYSEASDMSMHWVPMSYENARLKCTKGFSIPEQELRNVTWPPGGVARFPYTPL